MEYPGNRQVSKIVSFNDLRSMKILLGTLDGTAKAGKHGCHVTVNFYRKSTKKRSWNLGWNMFIEGNVHMDCNCNKK